jgi:hypothetical protein
MTMPSYEGAEKYSLADEHFSPETKTEQTEEGPIFPTLYATSECLNTSYHGI